MNKINITHQQVKKPFWTKKRKDLVFYIALIAFPVAQFCIFYVGVNINSFLLVFKSYNNDFVPSWVGLANIINAFKEFTNPEDITWMIALKNSLISYFVGVLVGVPLSLLFSYYIYKKMILHKLFKVLLFMPSIITSIVMVLIFQFFANEAIPRIFNLNEGLLSTSSTAFTTVLFYSIFTAQFELTNVFIMIFNNIFHRQYTNLDFYFIFRLKPVMYHFGIMIFMLSYHSNTSLA
jgi:ABC-type sugar transport system permease subunit